MNAKKTVTVNLSKELYLYPTISLYLGGSGIQCGKHFMKMRNSLPEDKQKLIEYFFIDSEKPDIEDYTVSRHYFYRNLYELRSGTYQPFWEERFPQNLGVNPVLDSREGCGVTRIFGAASLANNIDDFWRLLDGAYNRISSYRKDGQRLQIFITASACGGTGAGMILDAAALVRHRFRHKGNPPIYLFLLGPDVFLQDPTMRITEDNKSRMQASAYALLKELHYFAAGNPFRSFYRRRDERIEVTNATESDRLFDWVYYLNGESHQNRDSAPKSMKYISWMVAETQFQLCASQIGQKVKQIIPNQREEKVKNFPDQYTHPDHTDMLDVHAREVLQRQSRKAFLASFSTKTVCFPRQEIAQWLYQSWLVEALECMLERKQPDYEEFDKLLGIHAYERPDGLLGEWKLTDKAIKEAIQFSVEKKLQEIPELTDEMSYEAKLSSASPVLADIEDLIRTVVNGINAAVQGNEPSSGARALPRMPLALGGQVGEPESSEASSLLPVAIDSAKNDQWLQTRFLNVEPILKTLQEQCWDVTKGKGVKWLNGFLTYLTDDEKGYLSTQAKKRIPKPDLAPLAQLIQKHKADIESLLEEQKTQTGNLPKKILWWGKYALNVLKEEGKPPYGEELLLAIDDLPEQMNALREKARDLLSEYVYAQMRDVIYQEAIKVFIGYRDNITARIAPKIENALETVRRKEEHYRNTLKSMAFEKDEAYTTVHLIDDEILNGFKKRLAHRYSIPNKVIAPLLTPGGISFGTKRLNIHTLLQDDVNDETIIELLSRHITEQTETVLAFLRSGWSLEEFTHIMNRCAAELDNGAYPMINFNQQGVGAQTQGWLLKPEDMNLPKPFGTVIDLMEKIPSQDPSCISVVSFVFGVPPNSLIQFHEMFRDYVRRLGDHKAEPDSNRYPLHVFKDAYDFCDEPYSPSQLEFKDEQEFERLLEFAKHQKFNFVTKDANGKEIIKLDIRTFEATVDTLKSDWNYVIELSERIVNYLRLHSYDKELFRLLKGIPSLQALYNAHQGGGQTATE
jgi:hypothetical protein